jgi:hypothetical protein
VPRISSARHFAVPAVRSVVACLMPTQPDEPGNGIFSSSTWGLPLMLLIALAWVAFFLFLYHRRRKKYGGPPRFVGPPLAGTARILFVVPEGRGPPSPYAKNAPIRAIALNVKIPGHQPYDATARQEVPVAVLGRIQFHGGTVAVQVDSTNLNYVRIDFDQPIT